MPDKKKSSHLGAGMLIGAVIGVGTAAFLQSKKGKVFAKDLTHKVTALQKKINAELKKNGSMTKDAYENLVDTVVAYYVKTKDIAKTEIPAVRKQLLGSWKMIQKELKSVK
jgi:gas vesicle protein